MSIHIEIKQAIRVDSVSRGRRLFEPTSLNQLIKQGNVNHGKKSKFLEIPKKLMVNRNRVGIVRAITVSLGGSEMYFAKADKPIPAKLSVRCRAVASNCWARFSWTEKTSSLTVNAKKAEDPPNSEKGRITTTIEQIKVDRNRASRRLHEDT